MDHLPSRLKSSNPRVQQSIETGSTVKNATSPIRGRDHSRTTEEGLLELAYGIPSLHANRGLPSLSSNGSSNVESPSKHGRSMSHPFPSLFQSKGKRQGLKVRKESDLSDGNNHIQAPEGASRTAAKPTGMSDKALVTGKCMTCDSTVRWPKELHVFRCTVCLMINDLKPFSTTAQERCIQGPRASGDMSMHETFPSFSRIEPLSIVRTRDLIEQCVIEYLLNQFGAECRKSYTSSGNFDYGHETQLPSQNISRSSPTKIRRHHFEFEQAVTSGGATGDSDRDTRLHQQNDGPYEAPNLCSSTKVHEQNTKEQFMSDEVRDLKHPRIGHSAKATEIRPEGARGIFKRLEDYIVTSFMSRDCINNSFHIPTPVMTPHAASEGAKQASRISSEDGHHSGFARLSDIDAQTLLLEKSAENGAWRTGKRDSSKIPEMRRAPYKNPAMEFPTRGTATVSLQSPRIDWREVENWYSQVLQPSTDWKRYFHRLLKSGEIRFGLEGLSSEGMLEIDRKMLEAQVHSQRVLLKATESLLKRPGISMRQPNDARFLLIILANPLLYPSRVPMHRGYNDNSRPEPREPWYTDTLTGTSLQPLGSNEYLALSGLSHSRDTGPGQHSGIIKRVLGLLSNLSNECHHHFVAWFGGLSKSHFQKTVELVGSFVTYRLSRQQERHRITKQCSDASLIPDVGGAGQRAAAALHITLELSGQRSRKSNKRPMPVYNDDWQIKAAARVMALLFSANVQPKSNEKGLFALSASKSISSLMRTNGNCYGDHGRILAISSFYNTLLDYSDLVADFEAWEIGSGKCSFCQYPFFLSIWAKIHIMEHDARRQMELKAREAFFDSIMTRKTVNQYLVLRIRRECLVEDSLKGVSEVVGSGGEEIKKGLRIEFKGEEGVDAGGLRKEWFLLLVRDLFNPEHGMFVYDEDSHFCYFNPNSFETSDQYFLVGVVLGLAIYNSTILDVALPPFAFRKLLAAGPTALPGAPSHAKPSMTYSLEDLAELRPALANGLRQLLEFDGDVEETFCRDFVADIERYGQVAQIPLCPDGKKIPVTNSNRHEFVNLYVRYLLDTAVIRQFEPFKRGFFTICGGNALSLFHPEEIELLVRGSDEPLDIESLQAVAIYENWGIPNAAETEPVIGWFWHTFRAANPNDQRKLLGFITGSDRIPAMGAASLVIKLSRLGDDSPRFPIARTCFNSLSLWRYNSRQKLESMLWRAVYESEGFGLK